MADGICPGERESPDPSEAVPTLFPMPDKNALFYGDNLDVLRQHIATESVDLIYLDPPFNSNATYNVLFKTHDGNKSAAQIEAFGDTWSWSQDVEDMYEALTTGAAPVDVAKFIQAMRTILGASNLMAYLVMMAPRLVELRRTLKPEGSVYLHCDPTASHYLKLLMDAVFGANCFQNEIDWCYREAINSAKRWNRKHDVILFYSRDPKHWYFSPDEVLQPHSPNTIKKYKYQDEKGPYRLMGRGITGSPIRSARDVAPEWEETNPELTYRQYLRKGTYPVDYWLIDIINQASHERLGYPTQKPLALLDQIVKASSKPGDVILDPFCGCGTAIDSAQGLGRKWIGIDITYIAVDLIIKRMRHSYGDEILTTFTTNGIPTDIEGAEALFKRNPFEFERWAVSLVNGQPNEKQVGDKGVDGRIRFDGGRDKTGISVVSVKGGQQVGPSMVRDLVGTMEQQHAEMALLITMHKRTPGMQEVADLSGSFAHPLTATHYPRVQILTVTELLAAARPEMPPVYLPYIKAQFKPDSEAVPLF